jgi:hypothetical protein
MYTVESLKECNPATNCPINQSVVDKINRLITVIEKGSKPKKGDEVIYTNVDGELFERSRLSRCPYSRHELGICESGGLSYVDCSRDGKEVYSEMSGGPWGSARPDSLTSAGKIIADFWTFGDYAGGGRDVCFQATVRRWKYKELRTIVEISFEAFGVTTRETIMKLVEFNPETLEEFTELMQKSFKQNRIFTKSYNNERTIFANLFDRYSIMYCVKGGWSVQDNIKNENLMYMYSNKPVRMYM